MEIIKIIIYGIIEGITEWLPISSTGHLIIFEHLLNLPFNENFMNTFRVIIQFGAILAVIFIYFKKIWPFSNKGKFFIDEDIIKMWFKILVACIPATIIGLFFDNFFEKLFYNYISVAFALIIVGIIFVIIENKNFNTNIYSINEINYNMALIIGICQAIAAIFPGVSRSGATIIGAIVLGVSREIAAEFTFFMAIPVMFGASLLKLINFGFNFDKKEIIAFIIGLIVSFLTSIVAIKFLINFIKKHDFKVFGYYRILIGLIILLLFII